MSLKEAKKLLRLARDGHPEDCDCNLCRGVEALEGVDHRRPEGHVITKNSGVALDGSAENHESFGLLSISRIQAGGAGINLFGSDIRHRHLIQLTVKRGERKRDLNHDWYSDNGSLATVWMSEVQFASAITSLNYGIGVPVTSVRFLGEGMEDCPDRTKMQEVHDEFEEKMSDIGETITEMDGLIAELLEAKGPMKVGDKKRLQRALEGLLMEVRSNVPYMAKQFSETMDEIVVQAKGEVEAYVTGTIQRAGLKAMAEKGLEAGEIPVVALPKSKKD